MVRRVARITETQPPHSKGDVGSTNAYHGEEREAGDGAEETTAPERIPNASAKTCVQWG